MPLFDIEYLFLQLRSKSVGEIAEPHVTCPKCNHHFQIEIDISNIKPKVKKDVVNQFMLDETGTLGITLKYPNLEVSNSLETDADYLDIVVNCIDEIFTDTEVFKSEDHTKEELHTFIGNMQNSQLEKVLEFFKEIPTLTYKDSNECPSCKRKIDISLEGLSDFFI